MAIREWLIDQKLYAAGAHELLNSFVGYAEFALADIMAWFQGSLRQPALQARKISAWDLSAFTRHLQLAGLLVFSPTDTEYDPSVLAYVPNPVPPMIINAWATTGATSCEYIPSANTYQLYSSLDRVTWTDRGTGIVRVDESGVDFAYAGAIGEFLWFTTRYGDYNSFPLELEVLS